MFARSLNANPRTTMLLRRPDTSRKSLSGYIPTFIPWIILQDLWTRRPRNTAPRFAPIARTNAMSIIRFACRGPRIKTRTRKTTSHSARICLRARARLTIFSLTAKRILSRKSISSYRIASGIMPRVFHTRWASGCTVRRVLAKPPSSRHWRIIPRDIS